MNTLIKVCKVIFIALTVIVAILSAIGMFTGGDPMIVLVYFVLMFSGIGVIASWKPKQ